VKELTVDDCIFDGLGLLGHKMRLQSQQQTSSTTIGRFGHTVPLFITDVVIVLVDDSMD